MITTNLRIPEHLHEAMKKSAEKNRRSLNREILQAIDFYLHVADMKEQGVKIVAKETPRSRRALLATLGEKPKGGKK